MMSDFFLELSANPRARKIIKRLGLPLPMPQPLRRSRGPWEERPLHDQAVAVGAATGASLTGVMAATLPAAGANPWLARGELGQAFAGPGMAHGRPPRDLDLAAPAPELRLDGLVFDASGITSTGGLRGLYDFFHPLLPLLKSCGRAVVLGRPHELQSSSEAAAAQAALEGFVRSLAKEIGKRGATAQLLLVEPGAENRAGAVLRFILSPRSAFVTGQPFRVSTRVATDYVDIPVRALEGKVALVTGAARGIGEATARLLAGEGARVICLDRPADDALVSRVAREVGGAPLLVDLAAPDAGATIAGALREREGGVDIVVHNAGITRDKTLQKMKAEAWEGVLEVNLGAVQRITAALQEGLLRDGGRVICLSSVAGLAGNLGQTNYAASKAGLIGWVRRQAEELAPRGISVNAVAPGFIETRLTAAIPLVIREVGRRLSALGQGGLPQDVAEVIGFLAMPGAAGLPGGVLRVWGGALLGAEAGGRRVRHGAPFSPLESPPGCHRGRGSHAVRESLPGIPQARHHRPRRGRGAGAAPEDSPCPARDRRRHLGRGDPARPGTQRGPRDRPRSAPSRLGRGDDRHPGLRLGPAGHHPGGGGHRAGRGRRDDRGRLRLHQQRRDQAAPEGSACPGAARHGQGNPGRPARGAGQADAHHRGAATHAQAGRAHHRPQHGPVLRGDDPPERDQP
jgi:3-oxoacyl-[acyl-carrier protein] reductase